MRHVLAPSVCVAVFTVIGLCLIAASRTGAVGIWTDGEAISPDVMHRARDVKNLPTLKIVDMTLVFPSE